MSRYDSNDGENNKENRIEGFLNTLKKYIQERGKARKIARVERIIFFLLKKPDYRGYELEIAEETVIHPTDVSATLKKLEKENWVFIKSLGKGERSMVSLNIEKMLRDGLPPRNDYEWKVLKFLNENGGSSSTWEIYNNVWENPRFFIHHHLYRVLKKMSENEYVIGGKLIILTQKGKTAFEAYKKIGVS